MNKLLLIALVLTPGAYAGELFNVDTSKLTEVARNAAQQQVPELADSNLPLSSLIIQCDHRGNRGCVAAVELEISSEQTESRHGDRCVIKIESMTIQIVVDPDGRTQVADYPSNVGKSSESRSAPCS